jgi:CDGSH-type Zn-finger protein
MATKKQMRKKPANDQVKIKVNENGPYVVSGGIPLEEDIIITDGDGIAYEWRAGKKYPIKDKYTLCRCGQSKNKPFCDGTHSHIEFDGTETAGKEPFLKQAEEISGPGLDLSDASALCIHAGFCDRAGGIWNLIEDSDDPEAAKVAMEEAGDCPSGRLVVWDKDGNEIEPEFEPAIGLIVDPEAGGNGALWVRGHVPIEGADGSRYEVRNRVTLCRCGNSSNKPFCDGTHLDE